MESYLDQKSQSELQAAHVRLEYLACQRKHLKAAIKESESSSMYMSTGTSFLRAETGEATVIWKTKLDKVEEELRILCREIQNGFEEKEQIGEE